MLWWPVEGSGYHRYRGDLNALSLRVSTQGTQVAQNRFMSGGTNARTIRHYGFRGPRIVAKETTQQTLGIGLLVHMITLRRKPLKIILRTEEFLKGDNFYQKPFKTTRFSEYLGLHFSGCCQPPRFAECLQR